MPRSSFGYLEDNTRLKSQILWSLCSSSDRVILCWLLFLLSVKENQFNFTEVNWLRLLLIHHALLTVNRKKYLFINLCAVLQTFFLLDCLKITTRVWRPSTPCCYFSKFRCPNVNGAKIDLKGTHPSPQQKASTSSFSCWTLKDVISNLSSWWFQVNIKIRNWITCMESNK